MISHVNTYCTVKVEDLANHFGVTYVCMYNWVTKDLNLKIKRGMVDISHGNLTHLGSKVIASVRGEVAGRPLSGSGEVIPFLSNFINKSHAQEVKEIDYFYLGNFKCRYKKESHIYVDARFVYNSHLYKVLSIADIDFDNKTTLLSVHDYIYQINDTIIINNDDYREVEIQVDCCKNGKRSSVWR